MENTSKQPPGFRFHLELLFLPCLHSQSYVSGVAATTSISRAAEACDSCFLRKLLPRAHVGFYLRAVLRRFLSWSCLDVASSPCCPCSCFPTLQRLSVFPQPLTDLLSSVLKCGRGLQGFPGSLPALLSEGSVELFMVSWFNQILKVAPFLSLLHIRLVFLLDVSPFYLVLVFWVRHLFFQCSFFPPYHSERNEVSVQGPAKSSCFPNKSHQLSPLWVGSSHLKSFFQVSPKSKLGVALDYCVLALIPFTVPHPPFSCPGCPNSVCSRWVPQEQANPHIHDNHFALNQSNNRPHGL